MCARAKKRIHKIAGMTLVEIMMAVGIIFLVVVPLVRTISKGIHGTLNFSDANKANQLAQGLIEEIKQEKWDENEPDTGDVTPSPYSTIGQDLGETAPDSDGTNAAKLTWDDIDDYNGLREQPPRDLNNIIIPNANKFVRTVEVAYVQIGDLAFPSSNKITTGVLSSEFKRIKVRVTWEGMSVNTIPIEVSTIRANIKRY